jgi:glycosyltransferase involved in cell wall biosynthesis
VVLLNSDTVVTSDWLQRLLDATRARPDGAIFGPLSNAAGWQSIPESTGEEGGFVTNSLPPGVDLDAYAGAIGRKREPLYPRAWIVNGFCYMLLRKAVETLGVLDEEAFPQGYGEEDDYSLRAMRAGFKAYVVDNCYVYHAKSKSFTDERRQQLKGPAQDRLYAKHSREVVSLAISETRQSEDLERARVHSTLLAETASTHVRNGPGSTAQHGRAGDGSEEVRLLAGSVDTDLFRPRPVPQSFQLGCLGIEWLEDEIALAVLRATVGLRRLELTRADLESPELPRLIAQCRIFVSGVAHGDIPLLPLHAMACGVPVVIVDNGSGAEFAEHGANALVVRPGDQEALREGVRKLLTNNAFRRRLIGNGLRTAWRHSRGSTASRLDGTLRDPKAQGGRTGRS